MTVLANKTEFQLTEFNEKAIRKSDSAFQRLTDETNRNPRVGPDLSKPWVRREPALIARYGSACGRILDPVLRTITDPGELSDAEPLNRSGLVLSEFRRGWSDAAAAVWIGVRDGVSRLTGTGQPEAVAHILDQIADDLPSEAHFSVPAGAAGPLAMLRNITRQNDWELRWLTTAPPSAAGEDKVAWLPPDSAELTALIDSAYPAAEARPGDPSVRGWAVLRDDAGQLVAAAADTSRPRTGRISAVMTAPAARGHGYGAAVTTALSRHLLSEFDMVLLGLYLENDKARRLYERTGFHGKMIVTSGRWTHATRPPAPTSEG